MRLYVSTCCLVFGLTGAIVAAVAEGGVGTVSASGARFSVRSPGVLHDAITELDWTQADNGSDVDWKAARAWCTGRGEGWRMPKTEDLLGIVDASGTSRTNCGDQVCKVAPQFHLTGPWFWTGESNGPGKAWLVMLEGGVRQSGEADFAALNRSRALCVRGSTTAPATGSPPQHLVGTASHATAEPMNASATARFATLQHGNILDAATKLEWTASDNSMTVDWPTAKKWCEARGPAWRLPTTEELMGIFDLSATSNTPCGPFTCRVAPVFHLTAPWFWTADVNGSKEAWSVSLAANTRFSMFQTATAGYSRALCVRHH